MFNIVLLIVLLLLLWLGGFVLSRQNVFSPSVLMSSIWIFCLSLFVLLPHGLPILSNKFVGALALWSTSFAFASLFFQSFRIPIDLSVDASKAARDVLLLLSVITFPVLIVWVHAIIGLSGDWAHNLRLAAIGGLKDYPPINGIIPLLWQVSLLLELYYINRKKFWRMLLPLFCFLCYGIATMSKVIFLQILFPVLCMLFFKGYIGVKHILISACILFFSFFVLQAIRQGVNFDSNESKRDFVTLYALSSMSAFDTLEPSSSMHTGENVFRFIYAIMHKLGWSNVEPINPLLPFIKHPIVTNTYTVMYPYYKDFGLWGIFIFALLLGCLFGLFFKCAQQKSAFFVILYSYLCTVIVLQYVADIFMTNFIGHVKFVLLLYFPFWISKRKLLME